MMEAYVTMKVYWDEKECPQGRDCKIHPRKPQNPDELKEDLNKFFDHSTVFKPFITSIGGIKKQ